MTIQKSIFSGMAVNGTLAPSEPITLERLKALHLNMTAVLPKLEDICPNPADVHPETFSALQLMAEDLPKDYARPFMMPFAGVEVHVRTDVTPGVLRPCTCKEQNQHSGDE